MVIIGVLKVTLYKKYGLLGRKLDHSLSPQIHDLIFKYTQLEGEYALYPMEPVEIGDFIKGLNNCGFSGLNVTIPYKNDVVPFLDSVSKEAKKIGSVNTILPTMYAINGYNSDYFGVKKMLAHVDNIPTGKKAMVLGSGGSAKTVVTLLKDINCKKIVLVSRDKEKAQKIFSQIKTIDYDEVKSNHGFDVLINTTPVGMYPNIDECSLGEDIICGFSSVVDLIYNPEETVLLKIARRHGIKITNGLYMLVAQAVKSQEIWNDIKISDDVIDKVYYDIMRVFSHDK